ncbi:MAG TPA: glycogen/starch synthase [Deinococcales bacterium]|nr:glycogen/starch synthase [Deinococcales bacterium]
MRVLYVSPEALPFSKTGGLGDVAGALPAALARLGLRVTVVTPWYATLSGPPVRAVGTLAVPGVPEPVRVGQAFVEGVEYVFLGGSAFSRPKLYGYEDDVRRFAGFCLAVPHAAAMLGIRPDVVHLNDWQSGLLAPILKFGKLPPAVRGACTVFSIHNLQYQGRWNPWEVLAWTGLPDVVVQPDGLEFWGDASCLKAGINYSERVLTVSPNYAREIQTPAFGFGLDGALRRRGVTGILNGLDVGVWDPRTDPHIASPFETPAGKEANRVDLRERLGLEGGRPLAVLVTRLADQKGLDLLLAALPKLLEGWNLAVLGSGERLFAGPLQALSGVAPGRVFFHGGFDDELAHRLYAGGDALLMPSRFEPCGLTQMIAMRYGTVPVVHLTGGLRDTVGPERGIGFEAATPEALEDALDEALAAFGTPRWERWQREGMAADFSWDGPAREHEKLYRSLAAN